MTQALKKPPILKKTMSIEVFSIEQPIELITIKDSFGKVTQQWRTQIFYFTTHDSPVTVDGRQHIPLSYFDHIKWDEVSSMSWSE